MKKFKLILALGMLLTCVIKLQNTIASPTNNRLEPSKVHTIEEQANAIKQYISKGGIELPQLVLGAATCEPDLIRRFDKNYIFLDTSHHKNQFSERSIDIDFNDLEQLQELATYFQATFDKIILDALTLHDTEWNKEHISIFRNMLRPNGEFILGIGITGYFNNTNEQAIAKEVFNFYANNDIDKNSGLAMEEKTAFLTKCRESCSNYLSLNLEKFLHRPAIEM